MSDPGNSYCAAPFVHLRLHQGLDRWTPCCAWQGRYDGFNVPAPHPNPLMHPEFSRLRRRMLAGDAVPSCAVCDRQRDDGQPSTRDDFNGSYGRPTEPHLRYLEMSFGNLCNLRCRMCGSGASSRWIADELRLGLEPDPLLRRDLDVLQGIPLDGLDLLRVGGGEPLMEQEMICGLLRMVSDAQGGLGNLEFTMVSNGTIDIGGELMELMLSCRKVLLQTSVDGLDPFNAYQRTGSVFAEIEPRLRLYDSMHARARSGTWTHRIAYSLGILNVGGFMPFVDWVSGNLSVTGIDLQPIYWPDWQALRNLPADLKAEMISELGAWRPRGRLSSCDLPERVIGLLAAEGDVPAARIARMIASVDELTGDSFRTVDIRTHDRIQAALSH
jgi:hypothetical protein